ncbi:MAG: hypothetical protein ABIJ09_27445 [Pseudomonadota bacterium]
MKRLVTLCALALGLIFALASATPPPGDDDASTARRDAGSTDRSTTDRATTDTGSTGTWNPQNYGMGCTSDAQCPGGKCYDIFGGQGDSACFKLCTGTPDCADFPYNTTAAQCASLGTGEPSVCIMGSGQNGPCGNPLNATCTDDDYGLCGTDSSGAGSCVRVCNPHDLTNATGCRVSGLPAGTCGCLGSDGCSNTLLGFNSGVTDDPDGVCAPVTAIGATCGYDTTTYTITPCTGDQECAGLSSSSPTGTCQTPVADGGSPDA